MAKRHLTVEEAWEIGNKLGVTWKDFDTDQFRRGMEVELEHGTISSDTNITDDNLIMTGKIALAHLQEYPDYYDRLERMEKEAEKYWANKKKK